MCSVLKLQLAFSPQHKIIVLFIVSTSKRILHNVPFHRINWAMRTYGHCAKAHRCAQPLPHNTRNACKAPLIQSVFKKHLHRATLQAHHAPIPPHQLGHAHIRLACQSSPTCSTAPTQQKLRDVQHVSPLGAPSQHERASCSTRPTTTVCATGLTRFASCRALQAARDPPPT